MGLGQLRGPSWGTGIPLGCPNQGNSVAPVGLEVGDAGLDLYSMGKDEQTVPPLTASVSKDDVIWANDGGFIGLASDY